MRQPLLDSLSGTLPVPLLGRYFAKLENQASLARTCVTTPAWCLELSRAPLLAGQAGWDAHGSTLDAQLAGIGRSAGPGEPQHENVSIADRRLAGQSAAPVRTQGVGRLTNLPSAPKSGAVAQRSSDPRKSGAAAVGTRGPSAVGGSEPSSRSATSTNAQGDRSSRPSASATLSATERRKQEILAMMSALHQRDAVFRQPHLENAASGGIVAIQASDLRRWAKETGESQAPAVASKRGTANLGTASPQRRQTLAALATPPRQRVPLSNEAPQRRGSPNVPSLATVVSDPSTSPPSRLALSTWAKWDAQSFVWSRSAANAIAALRIPASSPAAFETPRPTVTSESRTSTTTQGASWPERSGAPLVSGSQVGSRQLPGGVAMSRQPNRPGSPAISPLARPNVAGAPSQLVERGASSASAIPTSSIASAPNADLGQSSGFGALRGLLARWQAGDRVEDGSSQPLHDQTSSGSEASPTTAISSTSPGQPNVNVRPSMAPLGPSAAETGRLLSPTSEANADLDRLSQALGLLLRQEARRFGLDLEET